MIDSKLAHILGNEDVTLAEMLDARENRVLEQQRILAEYKLPLISFTLNIPGSLKNFPLAEKSFYEGKKLIVRQLKRYNINIVHEKNNCKKTGFEAFFAVDGENLHIKRLMVEIEEYCSLGRIFDIDVLSQDGEKISRQDINMENRRCLLCGEYAHVCARSRKHDTEALIEKTIEIMTSYFNEKFADMCSSCAGRAMMYEVCTTPKPGLVDRANTGSHKDMDIYSFVDSSAALTSYFRRLVLAGIEFHSDEPQNLFEKIRYAGMEAEYFMFKAANANTHKGLIFSLGIICAALGYLFANNKAADVSEVLELSRQMTVGVLNDFSAVTMENAKTYGEKLYAMYGITGIRGEAANGFVSVEEYGLPVLNDLIDRGFSLNDAGALALINLIANVKDTNIISRSNIYVQNSVQQEIKDLIESKGIENITMDEITGIDNKFIRMNLSPGGCADLLAVTYMLCFIQSAIENE